MVAARCRGSVGFCSGIRFLGAEKSRISRVTGFEEARMWPQILLHEQFAHEHHQGSVQRLIEIVNEDPLDGPLFQSATALRVDNQIRASGIRNPSTWLRKTCRGVGGPRFFVSPRSKMKLCPRILGCCVVHRLLSGQSHPSHVRAVQEEYVTWLTWFKQTHPIIAMCFRETGDRDMPDHAVPVPSVTAFWVDRCTEDPGRSTREESL